MIEHRRRTGHIRRNKLKRRYYVRRQDEERRKAPVITMSDNILENNFGKSKGIVLPVIHVASQDLSQKGDTVQCNVDIAKETGCDGVWLINHEGSYWQLLAEAERVIRDNPGFWVGVNCLDIHNNPAKVMRLAAEIGVKGVWVDNAGIDESALNLHHQVQWVKDAYRQRLESSVLYFGGVAFKHQRHVKDEDLKTAGHIAKYAMSVVVTSGEATAKAADVNRVKLLREGIWEKPAYTAPLAIASGLTPDNVEKYLPYAEILMVASGISSNWTMLDKKKTEAFVHAVKAGVALF